MTANESRPEAAVEDLAGRLISSKVTGDATWIHDRHTSGGRR